MKKPLIFALSGLMLGMSATAMADDHWRHDHDAPRWSNSDRGHHGEYVVFKRGDRIPVEYRSSRYYVSDWRAHRLYEPPRDSRWMFVNNHYVLVSRDHFVRYVR
ncbi:RcnB family protein [Acinetobacter sp.]|uniref:RcnB family protein n=1 Tax=Acinetobacter sp. TaxID=472 RepID=UPI0031D09FE7